MTITVSELRDLSTKAAAHAKGHSETVDKCAGKLGRAAANLADAMDAEKLQVLTVVQDKPAK